MRTKKKNPLFFYIFILIALVVAGYFGFKLYVGYLKSPVDSAGKVQTFTVDQGQNPSQIAKNLEQAGLIRAAWVFMMQFKASEHPTIQAGDFDLSAAMSTDDIIKELEGGSTDRKVTLLEGWRTEQMAQVVEAKLGISQADFLKAAKEGYMFPDTYFFDSKTTADSIVQTMRGNFDQKFTSDLKQKTASLGLTEDQAVTLASLVEREGRSDGVRQQVASIMLKRLKAGMPLNIDATVRYAMDTQAYKANPNLSSWWGAITQADYANVVSPYNTYLNNGLPPAPICNPSVSSLTAVANADPNTPYVYYYHDAEGNSYYAKTLDEHNQQVEDHR